MVTKNTRNDVTRSLQLFFLLERCIAGFLYWALRDKEEQRFDNKLTEFLASRKSIKAVPAFNDEPDVNEKPVLVTDLENYLAQATPMSPNPQGVFGRPAGETEDLFALVRQLRRQRNKVMHGMLPDHDIHRTARDMALLFGKLHRALSDRLPRLADGPEATWTRIMFLSANELLHIADGSTLPRERPFEIRFDNGTIVEHLNPTDHVPFDARKFEGARHPKSGRWSLWISGKTVSIKQLEERLGRAQRQLRGSDEASEAVTGYLSSGAVYEDDDPFGIPLWRTAKLGHGFLCAWLPPPAAASTNR